MIIHYCNEYAVNIKVKRVDQMIENKHKKLNNWFNIIWNAMVICWIACQEKEPFMLIPVRKVTRPKDNSVMTFARSFKNGLKSSLAENTESFVRRHIHWKAHISLRHRGMAPTRKPRTAWCRDTSICRWSHEHCQQRVIHPESQCRTMLLIATDYKTFNSVNLTVQFVVLSKFVPRAPFIPNIYKEV